MKLANKVELITGAGSGQGAAAPTLFASEGALVAAVDINEAAASETAKRINSQGGIAFAMDCVCDGRRRCQRARRRKDGRGSD